MALWLWPGEGKFQVSNGRKNPCQRHMCFPYHDSHPSVRVNSVHRRTLSGAQGKSLPRLFPGGAARPRFSSQIGARGSRARRHEGVGKRVDNDRPNNGQPNRPCKAAKNIRKTLSPCATTRKPDFNGYPLMLIGYMRVSRTPTDRTRTCVAIPCWRWALMSATCTKIKPPVPGMIGLAWLKALEFVRPGDVLVVWKLDRLGRSLSHLLAIVTALKDKQVAFRSLTEVMDTTRRRATAVSCVRGTRSV